MLNKKARTRIEFIIVISIILLIALIITFKSLEKNIVYFFSPTEILNENINMQQKIRIGGLVKEGSLKLSGTNYNFVITDKNNEITVNFSGTMPNLFAEGKGVIAEGILKDKNFFIAETILAKHDENYMPPEVAEILKSDKSN